MENSNINRGHYLELMDRLHVVMCNIDTHILDHPLTKTDYRLQTLCRKAIEDLYDAYQITGELDHDQESQSI